MVYQPKRSLKLQDVELIHLEHQTRYKAHMIDKKTLLEQVGHDISRLKT